MFPATSEIFLKKEKGMSETRFVLPFHQQECEKKKQKQGGRMLEGIQLSKIQAQKEIKFTDTNKGDKTGITVVMILESYQRGKKSHRKERKRYIKARQCFKETNWKIQSNFDASEKKKGFEALHSDLI